MNKTAEITLTVTAKDFGTRTVVCRGKNAAKLAEYYRKLWRDAGHIVTG